MAPRLQRILNLALLGNRDKVPELVLVNNRLEVDYKKIYQLTDDLDREGIGQLKDFLDYKDELYLFLTNHFCYPAGTKIVTISRVKPTILLYKKMQPIQVFIR